MTLGFKPAPDILAEIGRQKKTGQVVIGFAAETDRHLVNARSKLLRKNCDALFVNPVERKDSGFSSEFNEGTLLARDGTVIRLRRTTKTALARRLIRILIPYL